MRYGRRPRLFLFTRGPGDAQGQLSPSRRSLCRPGAVPRQKRKFFPFSPGSSPEVKAFLFRREPAPETFKLTVKFYLFHRNRPLILPPAPLTPTERFGPLFHSVFHSITLFFRSFIVGLGLLFHSKRLEHSFTIPLTIP